MRKDIPIALFLVFFLTALVPGRAQPGRIDGEILIRLRPQVEAADFLREFTVAGSRAAAGLGYGRRVGRRFNVHLLRYDTLRGQGEELLGRLRRHPRVEAAQFNYRVSFHGNELIPNDPEFDRQWGFSRIGLPEVWAVTTGGETAQGDEIVVAVLDSGFDPDHEDIRNNVWINREEVPGDGLDNDKNGYVDDVAGWNFIANSAVHPVTDHGQSVAGLVGAEGDNNLGVTGVNWKVRLMLLSVFQVDQIVEAYEYALDQRDRYNRGGGEEGSFVVATNASFGIPKVFCSELPVWGGMYDLLGAVGVLSAGGPENTAWDVDEVGDMPTTCTSDFLLTVLNTNIDDERHQGTAWGEISIDMGAPGRDSYTTKPFDSYGLFQGNSAAVPHLAGSIALLYSLPCPELAQDALARPRETALSLRHFLLEGVDPLEELDGFTVTGGRLNVFNAMELIQEQCGGSTGPLAVLRLFPNPADRQTRLEYETPDFMPYLIRVFNTLGQEIFHDTVVPSRFSTKFYDLPTASWPAGVYFVTIGRGEEVETRTLSVHH